jgi:dihydroneopterin aldolase
MKSRACVELKDLQLHTQIGTYAPGACIPDRHLLDITLWIDPNLVLITVDAMNHVFDYDPLVVEIDRLSEDGHYETQERLLTRIAEACALHPEIESLELCLRKTPVRENSGTLGVRLYIDQGALIEMRKLLAPKI